MSSVFLKRYRTSTTGGMSSVCLPTLPPLRAGRFGASGFFWSLPRHVETRRVRRARRAETRWAFLGVFGASREPPGVLSGPRGGWMNVECTSQVEPDRKGRSLFGRCSRVIRSVFACYFCRFVWFCDPRANAISLLAERRIRGRLLGRLRLELPLSGSKCAIPAQRKDGLDFSEGVTCFVC